MQLSRLQYTAVGCLAPIFWGLNVPFVRLVAEHIGQPFGMAILCGIAFCILLALYGVPPIAKFNKAYLLFGVGSAVLCQVTLCFAVALSSGGAQTAEVGMVNYLWPCMTMVFACLFNGQKAKWWLIFGIGFAVVGIMTVLSGGSGFDVRAMIGHMKENPVSYLLAFCAAVAWSAYSSLTRALSRGLDPSVIIFAVNTVFFLVLSLSGVGEPPRFDAVGLGIVVVAAVVAGGAYAVWTAGVANGSMTVMAIVSYFTPVLSCVFCWLLLDADLTANFWKGVGLVVAGSLICWAATRAATANP